MKVTVYAADAFVHGNRKYEQGDAVEVNKGEAEELTKAGLVTEQATSADQGEEKPQERAEELPVDFVHAQNNPAQEEEEQPSEEQKMDEPTANKMEKPVSNKARKASKEAD